MAKFDWTGLETQREAVREVAHRIARTDTEADEWCQARGLSYNRLLGEGYRNFDSVKQYPIVAQAVKAQRDLSDLTRTLQEVHSVNFWVVRAVYGPILNPTEEEHRVCRAAVDKARRGVRV